MLRRPARSDFEQQLGQEITVRIDDAIALTWRIAEVRGHGAHETDQGLIESYSVLFHGPLNRVLPQGNYRFSNPALYDLVIFIVPLGPRDDHMVYEAVFN